MQGLARVALVSVVLMLGVSAGFAATGVLAADGRDEVVIVFKDGHRQSLSSAEISRIDVRTPAAIVFKDGHREKVAGDIDHLEFGPAEMGMMPSRMHFVGKWEVGQGGNGSRFFITLNEDGTAHKSIGSPHGTWTLVNGEAHIDWDDGWHDAIRKVGSRHEKVAHEPGKTFDDTPSNVTAARNTDPRPI